MDAPIIGRTHYTQLKPPPESPPDDELVTYIREVGRLLAEGHIGKWALIKKTDIVGVFDTEEEAVMEGYRRFTDERFLLHQIQEYEPLYRVSLRM